MKHPAMVATLALSCVALIALNQGCGKESSTMGTEGGAALSGEVKMDGSSTVFPISEAVAYEFGKTQPKVKVSVGTSGTGGGFKKFGNGETDIANASRPIKDSEIELCQKNGVEYIELPIAYDGLAIVVNPKNTWAADITVEELKTIWAPESQGKIMKWNQIRPTWPDKEIHLFGPGVDSGTFDYFTEAICGKKAASRGDYTSSEDDNVLVEGVARDDYALGYFGLAYYESNMDKLKLVPVNDGNDANGAGAIAPSAETVRDGTYQPLSRPLFIYVNKKSMDRPEIAAYLDFYLAKGAELSKRVGYIELPDQAYTLAKQRLDERITGTLFSKGSNVGVKIEDLLAKEQAKK